MATKSEKRRVYIYINDKQVEGSLKSLTAEARRLRNAFATTSDPKEQQRLAKELQNVEKRVTSLRNEAKGLNGMFGGLKKTIKSNVFTMVSWTAGIGAAISAFGAAWKTVKDYEQAIADLGAITGSEGAELEKFSDKVLDVSQNTGKGAVEIAKAFQIVGSAQPELLKSSEALGNVTESAVLLAKAGNIEIPAAAAALTKSMNQFGASSAEAAQYTDILAASQQKGTATIEQLAESMVKGGSTANAFKISFEDTNAILQGFAKGGVVGSEAGTQMSGVLSKLAKVSQKEFNPAYTSAVDVIDNLSKANLSYTELIELTDTEGAKWLSTLLNQNDTVQNLSGNIYEHNSALNQAEQRYDTVAGKQEEATASMDRFILSIQDGSGILSDFVKGFLDGTTEIFNSLTEINNFDWSSLFAKNSNSNERAVMSLSEKILKVFNPSMGEAAEQMNKLANQDMATAEAAFSRLSEAQLLNKDNAEKIIQTYLDMGLNVDEAKEKYNGYLSAIREVVKVEAEATEELENNNTGSTVGKAAEEAQKKLEQLNSKIKQLAEEQKINALSDDEADLERIRAKYQKIIDEAVGHEEQIKELELLRDEALAEKELEQEEIKAEKEAEELEKKYAFMEEIDAIAKEGVDRELDAVNKKYEELYEKADKYSLDTTALQKEHAKEISRINQDATKRDLEATLEAEEAKRQSRQATYDSFSELVGGLEVLLGESEGAQKAAGLAHIAIETSRAIASLTAASEANPANVVTFGTAGALQYAAGLIRIFGNIAQAKRYLSFDRGGFTGDGFGSPDSSGFKVAGVAHEGEWYAPKWMVDSPMYADTINMLETARQMNTGFAAGGPTSTPETTTNTSENNGSAELINAVNALTSVLNSGIKADAIIDQFGLLKIKEGLSEIEETQENL